MKMITSLAGCGIALAIAATIASPMFTSAGQLKGGQLLIAKPAAAVTAPAAPAMNCPLCKDENISFVDKNARGAIKPLAFVQKHSCGSCETTLKTTGVGKQARQVAVHTCAMENCCK